jgi:MoaA/NifB/PqqE/SkfB family radical SAM enzyme
MTKFFSIKPVNQDSFVITWDMGRRCNYDCSYCPSHRHDNFSPHASLDSLKSNADFVFEYINLLSQYKVNKQYHLSFTGGEPTVNPHFLEFSEYINFKKIEKLDKDIDLWLDVTTNGAMSSKIADGIIKNYDHVTISYHAEVDSKLKKQVKERIIQFKNSGIKMKVNVMFHFNFFDECKDLCDWLKENDVNFIPRLIGENPTSPFSQGHLYTQEQKDWLKDFWNIDVGPLHRPCCGGRSFKICNGDTEEITKSVNYRNFKGWSCAVNWYFLHIDQQNELIYHHQTCQAKLDSTRGSIGKTSEWESVITDLRDRLVSKQMPIIQCPNDLCGCGLCIPKSKERHDLLQTMPYFIKDMSVFNVS